MKDLIEVTNQTINNEVVQAVSARELHTFLESKQEFANWIKYRVGVYSFVEGSDFLIKLSKTQGRPAKEYAITLDMAKELSMVERTDKGKQARKYFIECEKKLNQPKTTGDMLVQMAQAFAAIERKQLALQAEQAQLAERQRITEGKLEDFATGAEHFSITAYNKLFLQNSISNTQANADGRSISKLRKNQGIGLGTAPHPVWGTINTYPKAMLDAYYHGELH